jgi:hypothetical protein
MTKQAVQDDQKWQAVHQRTSSSATADPQAAPAFIMANDEASKEQRHAIEFTVSRPEMPLCVTPLLCFCSRLGVFAMHKRMVQLFVMLMWIFLSLSPGRRALMLGIKWRYVQ